MSKTNFHCQRKVRAFLACPRVLICLLLPGVLAFMSGQLHAQSATKEYQIKAAFLYNFVQFVEWPTNTFATAESPFVIGVLGADPFGHALDDTIQGETIQNHKIIIRRSQHLDDLRDCQMIFICKSEKGHVQEILARLGASSALTVSELQGFAVRGGMINFYLEENKVRFEINPATARHEGLKISSQLLSLGKIIASEPGGEGK